MSQTSSKRVGDHPESVSVPYITVLGHRTCDVMLSRSNIQIQINLLHVIYSNSSSNLILFKDLDLNAVVMITELSFVYPFHCLCSTGRGLLVIKPGVFIHISMCFSDQVLM